jgi:hypothetical protein
MRPPSIPPSTKNANAVIDVADPDALVVDVA